MTDETPTSDSPLPVDRRIGQRLPLPGEATLTYPKRRLLRSVRDVTTAVDIVDASITGIAVRVTGDVRIPLETTVQLSFRASKGVALVRRADEPDASGSRVYGLEVLEASKGLTQALRTAVGEPREDVGWRWEQGG